jgi:hypothetical protein
MRRLARSLALPLMSVLGACAGPPGPAEPLRPAETPPPHVASSRTAERADAAPEPPPADRSAARAPPEARAGEASPSHSTTPHLSFAAPHDVAPAADEDPWQKLIEAIWNWPVLEASGLPAVSEDGRSVCVLHDERPFTGPPQFNLKLVEMDVDHTRPDRVTTLLTEREFEAALPAESVPRTPEALAKARQRLEELAERVHQRVDAAAALITARPWLPLTWYPTSALDAGEEGARAEDLVVTLSQATRKQGPTLHARSAAGPSWLEREAPELRAPSRSSRWGPCTYQPRLSQAAADRERRVLLVQVEQIGPNDLCETVPTVHVYRLGPTEAARPR